ncbi:ABC transporter ATP-binding protein [Thiofilum flexile]|uniref:ABC transporter ATP-binding protein n=1 Tax=Thiofilum flexile TaxID=125627 RepID=UPI00035CCA4E|nr:ATP-binding cassette domain-containing protein [Thiofilum flexile]
MKALQLQQISVGYPQYPRPLDLLWEWLTGTQRHTTHYALQDISFELEQGSTLGIVGDNGAGKSTLLRVLAGTLQPTAGVCLATDQRAALLELGASFQSQLSGLDNIRLGLALRGLSHAQINEYLPTVIEFAELQPWIEQPLKTYSSGMVMRLGFALATVLSPQLLIVDEALSVGDQHFQKKSLQRIKTIVAEGASLVFCSHNLYQVRELCQQAIWLEQGRVRQFGKAQAVVDAYQTACREREVITPAVISPQANNHLQSQPFIQSAQLLTTENKVFNTGAKFGVEVLINLNRYPVQEVHLGIVIRRNDEIQCYGMSTLHEGIALQGHDYAKVHYVIDELPLLAGDYCLELWLIDQTGLHVYDSRERCCHFQVQQSSQRQGIGVCQLPHRWKVYGL